MILFYERALHKETSQAWIDRCRMQIASVLECSSERAGVRAVVARQEIGHADIAVACALRFIRDVHPGVFSEQHFPALTAHANQCEAMACSWRSPASPPAELTCDEPHSAFHVIASEAWQFPARSPCRSLLKK